MNSNQHRCMNQVPASENRTQQRSLNSSLEATVGSPLVHLGGMLFNGSTSSLPNSPLQPSVTSITYGPWTATAGSDVVQSGRPIFDDFSNISGRISAITRRMLSSKWSSVCGLSAYTNDLKQPHRK
ncbi:hypothetical protein TNCV_4762061 [Trichonephila clavipes]|nr:hypothetical protein TNCV_4762061 [Trichonephila clavipes]